MINFSLEEVRNLKYSTQLNFLTGAGFGKKFSTNSSRGGGGTFRGLDPAAEEAEISEAALGNLERSIEKSSVVWVVLRARVVISLGI